MEKLSTATALAGPVLGLVLGFFVIAVAIAWIVVPFAVIGIKPLLRQLIAESRRTNALLESAARTQAMPIQGTRGSDSMRAER